LFEQGFEFCDFVGLLGAEVLGLAGVGVEIVKCDGSGGVGVGELKRFEFPLLVPDQGLIPLEGMPAKNIQLR